MNEGTSKFLLNWINANASTETELVSDIKDPCCKSLLLKILCLVDKDTGKDLPCERDFDLVEVLSLVISYLEGFHRRNFTTVITEENIENKEELEIGKVITLLLCAATKCEEVALFVNQITRLSVEDQFHFKFLIESVLTEMEEGSLTAESFETILKKQVDVSFGENQTLELNGSFASPITVQSPVEAFFTNSPLKSLVASPQLRSRQNQLMLNKLQQKVIKLQATLDSQMHLQSELETELTEKNKQIDARDSSILELRKEVTKLMSAADELELMRHFKEECGKAEKENARLKQKVFELQTFKQQCGDLEGKMADFVQEKEQFEKEQAEAKRFKSSIERYKTKVYHMEFKTSELEAALSRKEQIILKLEKEMEEVVCSASKSAEMMREMPRTQSFEVDVDDVLLEGVTEDGLPNLNTTETAPVNIDSQIIELELEKDRLTSQLSTCVNQEEFLALKETLAYTQETQSSYKENYIAAKSRILELEEELSKINAETQMSQQSLKKDLELKDKRLQQTAIEIDALVSLKEGLEGSLQTCSARAHDDKLEYDKELDSKKEELEGLNKQRKDLEEALVEKTKQIRTLELERDQIRDAYEQMLLEVRKELDLKIEGMQQDKAATLDQFRLRTKQLEEDRDKIKEEFAKRQKLMLEEETKNAAKRQEACDAEHAAWKKKFDQLSQEAMDTRSEMLENLKKHSDEMMVVRKAAREREDKLDDDTRRMREKVIGLESQLLNAGNTIAELQLRLQDTVLQKEKLEEETKKLSESQKTCESYALKAKTLEASVEQLRKDAELEKESLRQQMQEQLNKRDCEINLTRQELENLKKDYGELEERQTGETERVLVAGKDKCQGLFEKIRELETTDVEKSKEIKNLKALLKTSVEENENAFATLESSRVDWDNKEQQLLKKVQELESTVGAMEEMGNAFAEVEVKLGELQTLKERLEEKVEEESLINRRLGSEITSLEAQLCHADQQIRKQRQDIENKSQADSATRKMIDGINSEMYHGPSLMEEVTSTQSDESLPLKLEDLSGFTKGTFNTGHLSLLNESRQSLSASCHSVCSSNFRAAIQTRASRRQSAIYLRGSTPPERRTTNSAAYFILGGEFGTETEHDEEVEYDWDRLAELQRRNASCLPHLKTSYPVETQMQPEVSGETDVLRVSMDAATIKPYNTRKRKSQDQATSMSVSKPSSGQTLSKSKSAPNVAPGKRVGSRRITEAIQSVVGSLRSRSNENLSSTNQDSENSARRESIAYEIGISPPKKTKANHITRRRTISRYMGTSHLLGEKNKVPSKTASSKSLQPSVSQERKPLKNRQLKK